MQVEFEKNDIKHTFNLRDISKEKHFIEFNQAPILKYLDLTTDATKTSTIDIAFDQEGIPYYIRSLYYEANQNNKHENIWTGWDIGKSGLICEQNINGYEKYKISVNSNFIIQSTFDVNNSSYFPNYRWTGNLNSTKYETSTTHGGGWTIPDVKEVDDINTSNLDNMIGQLNFHGNIQDLTSSWEKLKELSFKGDYQTVYLRIYVKKDANIVYGKFEYYAPNGTRNSSGLSHSTKIAVATYD